MSVDFVDTYAAALAALFGGVGVKVLDRMMSKRSEQFLEASKIREELRQEIVTVRAERDKWETEADEWREKYYAEVEDNLRLNQISESLRLEVKRLLNIIHPDMATSGTLG